MNSKKHICIVLILAFVSGVYAQVQTNPPMRQVLGTTGGSGLFPSGSLDFTVGEPMIETFTPGSPFTIKSLTQGFQQPYNNSLNINLVSTQSTCIGGNNGSASISMLTSTGPLHYYWYSPLADSTNIVSHLAPGVYHYMVTDGHFTINDSVIITEEQVACIQELEFYTGITPNGDGNNDTWFIEHITDYPENTVSIFNRWGNLIWKKSGYDNVNVVWDGTNTHGVAMPDATYFYVVEIMNKTLKGWVQLTH